MHFVERAAENVVIQGITFLQALNWYNLVICKSYEVIWQTLLKMCNVSRKKIRSEDVYESVQRFSKGTLHVGSMRPTHNCRLYL